ncbi:MAG TPA: RNA-binding domain-containing protein [Anaerolineaceae bacterium]|nr:RNA-binding domain-containing protein [Anaerolineaceae bacterium]
MANKQNTIKNHWFNIDLHLHTIASTDYQQLDITLLDILKKAEEKKLDVIAITDHNTVSGYKKMLEEINQLEILLKLNRILPHEKQKLNEYQRLMDKLLVLPGFEFTATFGFHILAIFPPNKPVREIEHLLLSLKIPTQVLDEGAQNVGATTDVISAYELINDAGGLVIAAHANSSNGVAMRGFNFGGQTKIAYTQDSNLHALEVTDLDQFGKRSTAHFFNGTKPEYPRRMHCIQGSDAHRLTTDPIRKKNFGVGDRSTEILLPEKTFQAIISVFKGNDFSRTRPRKESSEPVSDFLVNALEEGSNIIQDFHESMTIRGGKLYAILADICAFVNTNGGSLFVGLNADKTIEPLGISDPEKNIKVLENEISNRISSPIQCEFDIHDYKSRKIIRILIPRGDDPPYALDDYKIYIREESETNLAVRDEIVGLVLRGKNRNLMQFKENLDELPAVDVKTTEKPEETIDSIEPKTGIEVFPPEERKGTYYFAIKDLRNGNKVTNVTQKSARRLWQYAIRSYLDKKDNQIEKSVKWYGNFGLLRKYKSNNNSNYDFVYKDGDKLRFFYGVNSNGLHGNWKTIVGEIDDGE